MRYVHPHPAKGFVPSEPQPSLWCGIHVVLAKIMGVILIAPPTNSRTEEAQLGPSRQRWRQLWACATLRPPSNRLPRGPSLVALSITRFGSMSRGGSPFGNAKR